MRTNIFFLFCLIIFSSSILSAQVGIATTIPAASLDVVATNPTGISTTTDGLLIPRISRERALSMSGITTSTLIYIDALTAGTQTLKAQYIDAVGFYYFDGSNWLKIANGSNDDWKLTGNIGTTAGTNFLGTTDPQDVRIKTNSTDRWNISNTNSGQLQSYSLGTAALPTYSWQGDQNTGLWSPAADNLAFSTAGSERTRIDANGNVGIGKTAPVQRLHLGNNIAGAEIIRVEDYAVTTGSTNAGELTTTNTTTGKALYSDTDGDIKVRYVYGDNTQSTVLAAGTQTITTTSLTDITGATITFTPRHSTVYLSFAISGYNPLTGTDPRGWVVVNVDKGGTSVGNFLNLNATNDADGSSGAATVSAGNFPISVTPGVSVTIKLRGRVSATGNGNFTIDKTNYTSYMTILD